jgi:crotonobetainyl-CoA:carnitine CoA-transferase CaiB-like acyl-CoA transferase
VPEGPLAGVRVLEFSQIVAASYSGVNLSDLGADVVKVEPIEGEAYRSSGAVVPGEGKRFQSLNRGKRSLAVDLQSEAGRALIHRIVPGFDASLINFRPGVAERLGIDYETLSQHHPGLIYARITGFGPEGPMASLGATDLVAGAYGGLVAGNGKTNDVGGAAPLTPAVSDYTTGLACAMAICAALYARQSTGRGQLIDGSLLQSAMSIQDIYVMRQSVTDAVFRNPMIERVQQLRADGASYEAQLEARQEYRTAGAGIPRLYYSGYVARDGGIVLGCLTRRTREAARRALGMEHDESDEDGFNPQDPSNRERVDHWRDEIVKTIRQHTVAEWMERFAAEGVPASPVNFPEELADDAQVEAMGIMVDLEHEVTGAQRVVGPVVRMSDTPTAARSASPALGVHTRDILREHGLSDDEIAALHAEGVIGGP